MTAGTLTVELVSAALAGDGAAVARFVGALTPVIHARVARALLRHRGGARGREVRQELEDMVQEVFVALFRDDGKLLRKWEPERGLGLRGFVGLAAEQRVAQILRSARRSPWTEDPTEGVGTDHANPSAQTPERVAAAREELGQLLQAVRADQSPQGLLMFRLLYVEQRSVESVCQTTQLSADAVYAWRSRLKRRLPRLLEQLRAERPDPAGAAGEGSS